MFIFLGKAYRSRDGVKTLAGDSTQALKMAAELNRGFPVYTYFTAPFRQFERQLHSISSILARR
jgi:hypothetical protein